MGQKGAGLVALDPQTQAQGSSVTYWATLTKALGRSKLIPHL